MSTYETIGSLNPSSSSTPIGSNESPLTVDKDNGTPCSSPLPMDAQIDGQTENEDVEGMGKLKLSMWNHFRRCAIIVQGTLVGIVKMGLGICITTTKDVQGERLKTSGNKSWCKNKIKK